jgi:DNA-binding transcriptional ArsR family regulator
MASNKRPSSNKPARGRVSAAEALQGTQVRGTEHGTHRRVGRDSDPSFDGGLGDDRLAAQLADVLDRLEKLESHARRAPLASAEAATRALAHAAHPANAANADTLATADKPDTRSGSRDSGLASDAMPTLDPTRFWALNHLMRTAPARGAVVYAGTVTAPTGEQFIWQQGAATTDLFKADWSALDGVLAALGHPVRLRLLKLIVEGKRSKAELEKLDGLGTSGQLYHHLNTLQDAGWVRSLERGTYSIPGERMVPLLIILNAAAG